MSIQFTREEQFINDTISPDPDESLFDAMCLWEAILDIGVVAYGKVKAKPGFDRYDTKTHDASDLTPVEQMCNDLGERMGGMAHARSIVATQWLPICQLAYRIANECYDYDECFDYDFCPWFLEYCIDHDETRVAPNWIEKVRKIHEIKDEAQKRAENWQVVADGVPRDRLYLRSTDGDDAAAWRLVIERAVKNRNPLHRRALRQIRYTNPEQFALLTAFCLGAFDVVLATELDAHPW